MVNLIAQFICLKKISKKVLKTPEFSDDLKSYKKFYDPRIEANKKAAYGDKRDHKKIEIFVDGNYVSTTTWASTCAEAKEQYLAKNPEVDATSVSCKFKPGAN
jgi:hypothetical protein